MSDTNTPGNPPDDSHTPKKRSAQDKKITNYANECDVFVTTLEDEAEIHAIAATHGYNDAEIAVGRGYVTALGGGLQGRQTGMGQQNQKQDDVVQSEKSNRESYAAFREIARASFPLQPDRVALGLTGDVPEDMDRFITAAKLSYNAAKVAPYTAKMTLRNYAPARLTNLLAALDQLTGDDSGSNTADGDAEKSTEARDLAYDQLRAWMKECRGVMRGALRGQHGLLAKLKL